MMTDNGTTRECRYNALRAHGSPPIITPSITGADSCSKISRSLHVRARSRHRCTTHTSFSRLLGTNNHFIPVENPAPPRPAVRFLISLMMAPLPFRELSARFVAVQFEITVDVRRTLAEAPVTTFTSSDGKPDQPCGLLRCSIPILVQNLVQSLRSQVLVKIVVHLRRRSPTARPNAFHLFQRKQTVG